MYGFEDGEQVEIELMDMHKIHFTRDAVCARLPVIVLYTSGCMLTSEEDRLLTETNAGTPCGLYFRRYWLPALLCSELPAADCPPVRIRILGEDLLAFRDTEGRVGILDEFCPH